MGLLFLIPMLLWSRSERVVLTKEGMFHLFLQAFFGVFLFSVFLLYGVKYTSATSAGIITSTVPAAIAVLSFFILGERSSVRQAASVCFAVLGIAVISFHGLSGEKESTLLGNTLILGAVISEALFTIYAKKLSGILTPLQMAVGVNLIGFLLFLPFAIREAVGFNFFAVSLSIWLLVVYYSLTASVLSFILWYRGVKKVQAGIAGLFTGFIPVAATLVSVIFLKEYFGLSQFVGMICVLGAIYLGTKGSLGTTGTEART